MRQVASKRLDSLPKRKAEFISRMDCAPSRKCRTARNGPLRVVTRGCANRRACGRENLNLLSCYELDGDYGLHHTLGRFCKANKPADSWIAAAIEDGDEQALFAAFLYAMRFAFVTLYGRNALKRIQLVEKWPEEAQKEYSWLCAVVSAATASAPAQATPFAPAVPIETPVEICAREFKELTGDKFRVKWLKPGPARAPRSRFTVWENNNNTQARTEPVTEVQQGCGRLRTPGSSRGVRHC